jgi:4-amino-4-deoxy-L-arabinose transferase-like glycosyltransferase
MPRARAAARPARRPDARGALVFICIAYAVIAAAYAVTIPFGHAPDESAHLPYIIYIADRGTLPVFHPGAGSYEFHQAPLYYVIAVPAFVIGRALGPGREYVAVRLFGILLGLLAICSTYLLARDFCPARPWLALGSAGFVAFLPMHVALSASVTNDIAAEAPFALGLWQMVAAMRDGWRWRRVVMVGIACGLAALMKSSGLALLPVAWLAAGMGPRESGWRPRLLRIAALTAVTLLICGWWLARNWRLYGDPLAWRAFVQAFANRPHPASLIGENLSPFNYVMWVTGWTFASFWGVFGNMKVFMPTWGTYIPLTVVTAAALAGLALELGEARAWEAWRRRAGWVLAMAVLLVAASFVRFNVTFFQAQGRYLFLALPVIAMALSTGWGRLFPTGLRSAGYTVLWLGMMALSALALPAWVLPAVGRPG